MSVANPFFEISLLPYQAPRFDLIEDIHYRPAFDEAMRQKRVEVDAIIADSAAPDFDNTILALEKSGALLSRVSSVFFAMTSAHTNDYLQALDETFSTELAGLANDIWLNDTLFSRVETVWHARSSLDDESRRLVEQTYQHFILAGATLSHAQKVELKSLNTESASLTSQFNQRLLFTSRRILQQLDQFGRLLGGQRERRDTKRSALGNVGTIGFQHGGVLSQRLLGAKIATSRPS